MFLETCKRIETSLTMRDFSSTKRKNVKERNETTVQSSSMLSSMNSFEKINVSSEFIHKTTYNKIEKNGVLFLVHSTHIEVPNFE